MSSVIKNRVFIVGSPRSGTTLIQSLLAAHPEIVSFPESHFFASLRFRSFCHCLATERPIHKERLRAFLADVGLPDAFTDLESKWSVIRINRYVSRFVELLDNVAMQNGGTTWVEKTPAHVYRIREIRRSVPDAKFIHIIRDGKDVVASIYDVTSRDGDQWGSPAGRSIDSCIATWIDSVDASIKMLGKEGHYFLDYRLLVENPEMVAREICRFLDLEYSDSMLKNRANAARSLIGEKEAWKSDVLGEIRTDFGSKKFNRVFSESEKQHVASKLRVQSEKVKELFAKNTAG